MKITDKTVWGSFVKRLNRFEGIVLHEEEEVLVHVPNTGRCRELFIPGATVLLEIRDNPKRKTKYELIMVYKGERLISIDSQAPNRVAEEALKNGMLAGFCGYEFIKREHTFGSSRFDLFMKRKADSSNRSDCCFMEVKGVTLEYGNVAMFPDAPTERGTRHINELIQAAKAGYRAALLFVIQMHGVEQFRPNAGTDEAFAAALEAAANSGVEILAYTCQVTEKELVLYLPVPVRL